MGGRGQGLVRGRAGLPDLVHLGESDSLERYHERTAKEYDVRGWAGALFSWNRRNVYFFFFKASGRGFSCLEGQSNAPLLCVEDDSLLERAVAVFFRCVILDRPGVAGACAP